MMPEQTPTTIAMWSGPRNLSTALMRSFENRADCEVWDEPFYAAYLKLTRLTHPMHHEIISHHDNDPVSVALKCANPEFGPGQLVNYQKHMTHHMVDGIPRDWILNVQNVFLIRDPHLVIASYQKKRESTDLMDMGFIQQQEIFDWLVNQTGEFPIVIDANRIREEPELILRKLCCELNIRFTNSMLQWPKGTRESDGIWASHWYHSVINSTQFEQPDQQMPTLNEQSIELCERALPYYLALKKHAI